MNFLSFVKPAVLAAAVVFAPLQAAIADSPKSGDFMIRLLGAGVVPQTDGVPVKLFDGDDLTADLGPAADVGISVVPATTLTYFATSNFAVELFCCFAQHEVQGEGLLSGATELGDTWIFPPTLTLQYHMDFGTVKPYAGIGVTYINFFNEETGDSLGGDSVATLEIDDAFGLALQFGIDAQIADNLYLNADIKQVFLDTDATWTGVADPSETIRADVDLNPTIISFGIGYKFNLFGHEPAAFK